MIQLTPQMRIFVAIEHADFRKGIDGLAQVVRVRLAADPFSGAAYVFRNRRGSAVKVLIYDGQGFWLCHKRLSTGRFRHWPAPGEPGDSGAAGLLAQELTVLLSGGDFTQLRLPPPWRDVRSVG